MRKIIHLLFVLVLAALIGTGVYFYLDYQKYAPMREDYERIANENYSAVFFSTFPIDNYTEDDFIYYREIYPLKSAYCIPDMETLNEYFARVFESWNEVSTVYLGVRPDLISAQDLLTLTDNCHDKRFEILIAYPSLDYWNKLDEEECAARLSDYKDFIHTIITRSEEDNWLRNNLFLYFYGDTQWLVGNSANYESDFNVNAGISHILSMYSDSDHRYLLTQENVEDRIENFETLINESRNNDSPYPDLSKWDVVFFGDSIIAFTETSSIPGAFKGLTGAHTYNCGLGGSSATLEDDPAYSVIGAVDSFLNQDTGLYEENTRIAAGLNDYFEHAKKKRRKCFVLNYGMNDFQIGYPVRPEDPSDTQDTGSYMGALRTAVDRLQEAYPDAVIVLMAPNYTSYFGNGLEPQSDVGGMLPDYVAAVLSLCDEKGLLCYNSYNELPIDSTNYTEYLLDGCHPNEATRYRMAQGVADLLRSAAEQSK